MCRSAGFWGTHAGGEKNAPDLVQRTIDAVGGCIVVCGEKITNTRVSIGQSDAQSAEEALCVPTTGVALVQLARQLTAAALNCAAAGGFADCSVDVVGSDFARCDTVCRSNGPASEIDRCIRLFSCLNDGGVLHADGFCQTGVCTNGAACNDSSGCADRSTCRRLPGNCHDRSLQRNICKSDDKCPAASNNCNDAIKTSCTVVAPKEADCRQGLRCSTPETCSQTSCPP